MDEIKRNYEIEDILELCANWDETVEEAWETDGEVDEKKLSNLIVRTYEVLSPFRKSSAIPREIVDLALSVDGYANFAMDKPFEREVGGLLEIVRSGDDFFMLTDEKIEELKKAQ